MVEDKMILDQVTKILIRGFNDRWTTVGLIVLTWGKGKDLKEWLKMNDDYRERL